jgi:hypothetical protein
MIVIADPPYVDIQLNTATYSGRPGIANDVLHKTNDVTTT